MLWILFGILTLVTIVSFIVDYDDASISAYKLWLFYGRVNRKW